MIFVFGSNEAGRHGLGAARHARKYYGAEMGEPEGRQGNSYAIPTKDRQLRPLALSKIQYYVERFIRYAQTHSDENFKVTAIGTGLAGYHAGDIAPMFKDAPNNCELPFVFRSIIEGINKNEQQTAEACNRTDSCD